MTNDLPDQAQREAWPARPARSFASKQMGDACEMLIAVKLTLAGIPAL
jgi:hypothetical protein